MTIAPGLHLLQGNDTARLRDLTLALLDRHPLGPLDTELFLVASNGMAQWLKLGMAEGEGGIAAAVAMQLPARFVWQAWRAVLGPDQVPETSPYDKPRLVWRLLRLLPELAHDGEPAFEPLLRYLEGDADGRRRLQLAQRLADQFDALQVHRPDWLAAWTAGRDELPRSHPATLEATAEPQPLPPSAAWQPKLWRRLRADIDPARREGSRAELQQRFLAALQAWPDDRPPPAGLPPRVVAFGLATLPAQVLGTLAALSRLTQVLMVLNNPSPHDWSDLIPDAVTWRAAQRWARRPEWLASLGDQDLHLHAHPLLAAWGRQTRDFRALLDAHQDAGTTALGDPVDQFVAPSDATLLGQLQQDLYEMRPPAEARALRAAQPVDWRQDDSLRLHIAHSPQREVEALHDLLLHRMAQDPTLTPRDVLVMVPQLDTHAAAIRAVFGLHAPGDPRRIPFTLADPEPRANPLRRALETLLDLPRLRLAATEVLDLLQVPALRRRFGIAPDDVDLLTRWVRAAHVHWGLDEAQRERLDLPEADSLHDWQAGLQRMLLGLAAGAAADDAGAAWHGIEPLDEVGGLEAERLGPLLALLRTLARLHVEMSEPAPPAAWGERLRAAVAALLAVQPSRDDPLDAAESLTLTRFEAALQAWIESCEDARLVEPLPIAIVREHLLGELDDGGLQQPFFGGGVTFATLMPMRAIPFRVVALLGMDDAAYPRQPPSSDFDLLASHPRPGDRSRREDDAQLFLEAILAARDQLVISWCGRDIHNDRDKPPSVLVQQLMAHLDNVWVDQDGKPPSQGLTVVQRLQPFHPDHFRQGADPRLASHALEWRRDLAREQDAANDAAVELEPWLPEGPLTIALLADFLRSPPRAFFRRRLGIELDAGREERAPEAEPFETDALQRHGAMQRLEQVDRRGGNQLREQWLSAQLRAGALPAGSLGRLEAERWRHDADRAVQRHAALVAGAGAPLPDERLDIPAPDGSPALALRDTLDRLHAGGEDGVRIRIVFNPRDLEEERKHERPRAEKILAEWVTHLAAHARPAATPLRSLVVGLDEVIELPPLAPSEAARHWQALLEAWCEGMRRPLPVLPAAAAVGLHVRRTEGKDADDKAAAKEFRYQPEAVRMWSEAAVMLADPSHPHWVDTLYRPLVEAAAFHA